MQPVFIISDNIISPLGRTSGENFKAALSGKSGILRHERADISAMAFYAALMPAAGYMPATAPISGRPGSREATAKAPGLTPFESLVHTSVQPVMADSGLDPADPRLVFILSSTKGNISLLESGVTDPREISLAASAEKVAAALGFVNMPLVISHACISGLQALILAARLLRSGKYDHAVVCGADLITRFILSGFQSFMAVSPEPCRPFDAERQGVTLGEAGATIVLSSKIKSGIRYLGGAVSNDANHISGPSRTGEELGLAIKRALAEAGVGAGEIGLVSAHGTATVYNDDMEARAMNLTGLERVPLNSLKGYFGHTLGAAGLVESIISIRSMKEQVILPTMGYRHPGTVEAVNVSTEIINAELHYCLKTASGFGGCNAAAVFGKS